jgi:hypothetical protein
LEFGEVVVMQGNHKILRVEYVIIL